jgi:hypothetical protein
MTLLYYRLRSAPFGALVGTAGAWFLGSCVLIWSFRPGMEVPAKNSAVLILLQVGALALGLETSFLVSEDVDPPEPLLRSAPTPFWHTPHLRLLVWMCIAVVSIELYVRVAQGPASYTASALRAVAIPPMLLVAACSFFSAATFGSYLGGSLTLGLVGFLTLVETAWPNFPLQLRDLPQSPTWATSRLSAVVGALLLICLATVSLFRNTSWRRIILRPKSGRRSSIGAFM